MDETATRHCALLELVAQSRDRQAFARLFDYFAPRLRGFFLKRGLSKDRADDLLQEVMLAVWRNAASYNPDRAAVSTWVYTIARNRYVDRIRRERRPEPTLPPNMDTIDPAETLDQQVAAERVRLAVCNLPPEQAHVVREAYYVDKSLSRIANDGGFPLGTVKTRARLALAKLRRTLSDP